MSYKDSSIKIRIANRQFDVYVERKKRKTVTLNLVSSTKLLVKSPFHFTNQRIKELIIKKEKWILEHVAVIAEYEKNYQYQDYIDGNTVYYLGKKHFLKVIENQNQTNIQILRDTIQIETKDISDENIKTCMELWYKQQVKDVILDTILKFKQYIHETIGTIRIKNQKTRWGSCSELGNLNFNWRLILLPKELIEYVVVHEMCHLKFLNHSYEFWNLVNEILPDFKERQRQLQGYSGVFTQY